MSPFHQLSFAFYFIQQCECVFLVFCVMHIDLPTVQRVNESKKIYVLAYVYNSWRLFVLPCFI